MIRFQKFPFDPAGRLVKTLAALSFFLFVSLSAIAGEFPDRDWKRWESPAAAGWSEEGLAAARRFASTTDTAAVFIVHGGLVVDEWGVVAAPLKCHSMRKSILSALFGKHVDAGAVDREATLADLEIDDNEPSLTDEEKTATVADLLKARSGVYHPALYETQGMKDRRPKRGSHKPGDFWYYNNWDFNVLGTVFEKLTGAGVYEAFEAEFAEPLGMQDFVSQRDAKYVSGSDSNHRAYPFDLSARDLARFGLLMCREGQWNGKQIVPADWVKESTRSYSDAGGSGGYGYMWWTAKEGRHYPGVALPDGAYSARGYRGHCIVVVPQWDLVVVHRVNTFQRETSVSRQDVGRLLGLIVKAMPENKTPKQADATARAGAKDFDVLIRGGRVLDGSGEESFRADVGINDGKIAWIGIDESKTARTVLDAAGRIVAPGFIDMHSHAESGLTSSDPMRRSAHNLVTQGITTVVVNQDGGGPLSIPRQRATMRQRGTGLNVVQLIGHHPVRRAVLGRDFRRTATEEEIAEMQKHVDEAMKEGAFGLSAGLEYVPGRYSDAKEMEALVASIAPFDGVYVVHERSSGSRPMWYLPSQDDPMQPSMIDNLQEIIDIGEATGAKIVATHIKARGVDFWDSARRMIGMIETARERGVRIYADQYPYNTSGSDGRIVLIPGWLDGRVEELVKSRDGEDKPQTPADILDLALSDETIAADVRRDIEFEIGRRGGAESIVVVEHQNEALKGKTLYELAREAGAGDVETVIQLQLTGDRTRRGGCRLRSFSMSERDVALFAGTPWTATSSDAGIALPQDGLVHPRFYGAFPRKIRKYALEEKALTLEEAIRVSTSFPASLLNIDDRGVIAVGAFADIVVFDPERVRDRADAFTPHRYSEGIDWVLVNGEIAVRSERPNGKLAGVVLRRD